MTERVRRKQTKPKAGALAFLATAGLLLVGCSTASNNGAADNPGVAGPSPQYHTYVGTQSVQWSPSLFATSTTFQYGGTWALSLDDGDKLFSYQNIGHQSTGGSYSAASGSGGIGTVSQPVTTLGALTGSTGFLSLTPNGFTSTTPGAGGYALEVPGEAVIMRPAAQRRHPSSR